MDESSLDVARFRTICEESPIGIFLCDENGQDIYSNPVNLTQMGLKLEDALGDGWKQAIHPDDRARVFAGFLRANVGVVEDITVRQQLQEVLERSQVMRSVSQMAAGLAHDFNNLLVVILGHAEIASHSLQDERAVRESLAAISHAGEQASLLTRQLLSVARKSPTQPIPIDLSDQLQEVYPLLCGVAPQNVELALEIVGSVPIVDIDPSQLQRLLLNLVMNAINAIDGEGQITIHVGEAQAPTIVSMGKAKENPAKENTAGYVELRVTDDGRGMDESTRKRVFEPFFSTQGTGTGLGLATCYAIVDEAAGVISVESEVGIGTSFRILLPESQTQPNEPPQPATARSESAREHILLVDDEPLVRSSLAILLRQTGYNVVEAESVADGLRIGKDESAAIDLIICDINLGDGSGLALREQLMDVQKELPFVFMSGESLSDFPRHEIDLGTVSFVEKPCPLEKLINQIEKALAVLSD